jgi:hypothetical protein
MFVRVRYTPPPGAGSPGRWADSHLRTWSHRLGDLHMGEDGIASEFRLQTRAGVVRTKSYTLVAAVRMRKTPGERDLVRVYNKEGMPFDAPFATTSSAPDWSLMHPADGHSYMLYYTEHRPWPIVHGMPQLERHLEAERKHAAMENHTRMADSMPTDSWEAIRDAAREELAREHEEANRRRSSPGSRGGRGRKRSATPGSARKKPKGGPQNRSRPRSFGTEERLM